MCDECRGEGFVRIKGVVDACQTCTREANYVEPKKKKGPWTDEDNAQLQMLLDQGASEVERVRVTGRTRSAIFRQAQKLRGTGKFDPAWNKVLDDRLLAMSGMVEIVDITALQTIAKNMDKTEGEIAKRLKYLTKRDASKNAKAKYNGKHYSKPEPDVMIKHVEKLRKCLLCGEDFHSTHSGNRRCQNCRGRKIVQSGADYGLHSSI